MGRIGVWLTSPITRQHAGRVLQKEKRRRGVTPSHIQTQTHTFWIFKLSPCEFPNMSFPCKMVESKWLNQNCSVVWMFSWFGNVTKRQKRSRLKSVCQLANRFKTSVCVKASRLNGTRTVMWWCHKNRGTHRGGWGLPVSQGEALIARVAIGGNVWSPVWRQREWQGQRREGKEEEEEKWQNEEKRENRDENTSRKAEGRVRVTGRRDPRTGKREEGDKAVRNKVCKQAATKSVSCCARWAPAAAYGPLLTDDALQHLLQSSAITCVYSRVLRLGAPAPAVLLFSGAVGLSALQTPGSSESNPGSLHLRGVACSSRPSFWASRSDLGLAFPEHHH